MTAPNLGEKPNSTLRDAVHFPVVPVVAAEALRPGQRVRMVNGLAHAAKDFHTSVGVVDPFLLEGIGPYDSFWLLVSKIDGQPRHSWSSPDFPDELEQARQGGVEEGACCYGGG